MTINIKLARLDDLFSQASEILRELKTSIDRTGPPPTTRSTPLVFAGAKAAKWRQTMGDWPRLNSDRVARASRVFESKAFTDVYRPGETRHVYVAACSGLRRIAMALHVPVFKVGSCASWGLSNRIRQLRDESYASAWFHDGRYVTDDDFSGWFSSMIRTRLTPSPSSPVSLPGRSYQVVLPDFMTADDFEERLRRVMKPAQLFGWLETPAGIQHCNVFEVAPETGRRSTAYNSGDQTNLSPASELYVFRPQSDFDRLLAAIEQIIIDAVLQRGAAKRAPVRARPSQAKKRQLVLV